MKFFQKKITVLEIVFFVVFVIYLIFNIQTPTFLKGMVDTPLGIVFVLLFVLFVFLIVNPILGILSLFVAYEFIRRSSAIYGSVPMIKYTPEQTVIDKQMKQMNNYLNNVDFPSVSTVDVPKLPPVNPTLEEQIVSKMAPFGISEKSTYVTTSFHPIMENIHNASYDC